MSRELIHTLIHQSNMSIEEVVEWIRELIVFVDQYPYLTSSSLARGLYDTMMDDQRCPRCEVRLEHLSYAGQQHTNCLYECIRCGEMY